MNNKQKIKPLYLLLADDDNDDRFFFQKALNTLSFPTQLSCVEDGKRLMAHLKEKSENLPDVLFLDLNMPFKNGSECLQEIKADKKLKDLPVIIYSTSLQEDVAELLYQKGAHHYIRKTDLADLEKILELVLTRLMNSNFKRPERSSFIITLMSM